jgi:hypothetical protein
MNQSRPAGPKMTAADWWLNAKQNLGWLFALGLL